MKSLFKIFVIGTDPCVIFLSNLDRVILLLLEVHASITFGVSHLRDPVKQVKVFTFSSMAVSVKCFFTYPILIYCYKLQENTFKVLYP